MFVFPGLGAKTNESPSSNHIKTEFHTLVFKGSVRYLTFSENLAAVTLVFAPRSRADENVCTRVAEGRPYSTILIALLMSAGLYSLH